MNEDDVYDDLKNAEKEAEIALIENPILNDVIGDLMMLDDESDKTRREKILNLLEKRSDLDEI
jgi:hypothetical protein